VVAPWFRSASGTTPRASSAPLAKGSGNRAAPTAPDWSAAVMFGNGTLAKWTRLGLMPCSARTDAASRYRMFLGALMAMVLPTRPDRSVTFESGMA
jgi:hypothetical protein